MDGALNTGQPISRIDAAHRIAAPQLSGTTVAGQPYTTTYTGHVTVINIWGAWCTQCADEAEVSSESVSARRRSAAHARLPWTASGTERGATEQERGH